MSTPVVPPRPARKLDPSPVRSPLNAPPAALAASKPQAPSNLAVEDVPPRPPSVVALPSLGQEGAEYASFDQLPPEARGVSNGDSAYGTPEQTRNISSEMPLHAPKASLPQSTAKSRIETVTRTDSTQAAAAGIGKSRPDDDVHKTPADSSTSVDRVRRRSEDLTRTTSADPTSLKPVASHNRPTSGASSRPGSMYEDLQEQGIPHIGVHTPLNPNAGDVQAPSGPTQPQYEKGVGFFNDGGRAHNRKRSGRHEFSGPPGSYGLHNHSVEPHDKFERDWYSKNRERAAMEQQNLYGRPKPETALSSVELNRIVTQTDDAGTAPASTPGEDLAFTASDAYTSRMSPKASPAPTREPRKRLSSGSQPAVESPLRRTSYPFPKSQQAVEDDDVDVIHIDAPEYRTSKVTGGGPVDGAIDLGAHAGNTAEEGGWFVERGTGTPILASDEVLKRHESSTMQAAVNPEYQFDSYDEYAQYDNSRRSSMRVPSRPSSRPGSVHGDSYQGGNLHRYISHDDHHRGSENHTPLEEIEEYEPLIPDDEDPSPKPRVKAKDVKRRPGIEHHHFPSRDIWEDTPSSMYYHTTVQTPDLEPTEQTPAPPSVATNDPEISADRDLGQALNNEQPPVKPHYATRAIGTRPGAQRFPSKDIWEDTPSSLQYNTTVGSPQMDESKSEPIDRATTSAIPGNQDDGEARATTGFTQVMRPQIPARPQRRSKLAEEVKPDDEEGSQEALSREVSAEQPPSPEKTKAPPMPDRPKPTIPVRPARSSRSGQANGAELAKSTSAEAAQAADGAAAGAPVPKAKPVVPARPGGEKIAAMKAGFMNDLNNRLKVGPQAAQPKTREIEPEVAEETAKAPLADARKGRAKGPTRRKPAASPSAAIEEKPVTLSISSAVTVWSIDEQDKLQVSSANAESAASAADAKDMPALEKAMSGNLEANPAEPAPAADLPQLEKVLSDNATANTEESAPAEPLSPQKPLSLTEIADASPEEQKSMTARLEASLAEIGAGPATSTTTAEKDATPATEVVQQTETEAAEKTVGDEEDAAEEIQGVAAS